MYKLIALLIIFSSSLMTQASFPVSKDIQDGAAPHVFLIGENERSYEKLLSEYQTMLLSVCENDMQIAYNKWLDMLIKLEAKAEHLGLDINGVKMWLNVFWNQDGTIAHIVYHPKPNSKNLTTDLITALFDEFINEYRSDIDSKTRYSHYGSAAFPTFPKRVKKVER